MGFLGKLIEGAVNVVLAPVDVIKDVITMGGCLTDAETPYTVQRVEKIIKNVEDAGKNAGEGDLL